MGVSGMQRIALLGMHHEMRMTSPRDVSRECPVILRQAQDERTWGFTANSKSAIALCPLPFGSGKGSR
jgi:hypothetical protein